MYLAAATTLCALLLSADPDLAKYDDLWTKRDDPQAATELATMTSAFKATLDYDKLWRVSRWDLWMADGDVDGTQKQTYGKAGWDVGEAAQKVNPQGPEAKYWTSVNIGAYSEAVGIFKALTQGLEGKFRDPLFALVKDDVNHQNAYINFVGPESALGRYYYKLPWPKHSSDKSKEWLNRALKIRPESLRVHYYLADTLKDHDKAAAKKELELVLAGDESYDPPEARRVKKRAQALLAQISK